MSENVAKLIDALQQGDMATANSVFQDDIGGRVAHALEQEKIAVAGQVFGSEYEIESDEESDIEEFDAEADDYIAEPDDGEPAEYDLELEQEEE